MKKVLAINGSPLSSGNTAIALDAVLDKARAAGFDTERVNVGGLRLRGCIGCGACKRPGVDACAFTDDEANAIILKMYAADALVIGSPVYYGGISGPLKCLLDRAYYSSGGRLSGKICAALVVQRRSGGMDALRQIENYFSLADSLLVPTRYWSILHGMNPGEVVHDLEGMANAICTGERLSSMLSSSLPDIPKPPRMTTNFIR